MGKVKQESGKKVGGRAERWVRKMGHHHHHNHHSHHKYSRYDKPRQEISKVLKYLIFFSNFFFAVVGIVCISLGGYLYAAALRPVMEAVDLFLNPAVVLICVGCLITAIALMGSFGALRENVCLLKSFALCLFICYIGLVIIAFVLFILFYSDSATGVSMQSILLKAVHSYHSNENLRDFMDYVQVQLSCCGATSQGFKDWGQNAQYNCSEQNRAPEQCGVPYSCCKHNTQPQANNRHKAQYESPHIGPLLTIPSSFGCGFDVQKKALTEIQDRINTDGCLGPMQRSFEGHAVIIGAVVGAIIIPVCLSVTFANIMAKQIERQRYLLDKEARKEERRRRRARQRFRDPFATIFTPPRTRSRDAHHNHDETTPPELRAKSDGEKGPVPPSPTKKDKGSPRKGKRDNRQEGKSGSRPPPRDRDRSKQKRGQKRKVPTEQKQQRKSSRPAVCNDREMNSLPKMSTNVNESPSAATDFAKDILAEPIYSDVDEICASPPPPPHRIESSTSPTEERLRKSSTEERLRSNYSSQATIRDPYDAPRTTLESKKSSTP